LRTKYLVGGPGTYLKQNGKWTKEGVVGRQAPAPSSSPSSQPATGRTR